MTRAPAHITAYHALLRREINRPEAAIGTAARKRSFIGVRPPALSR